MSWIVIYANTESDKYCLGVVGGFNQIDGAIEFARKFEERGGYWAGIVEERKLSGGI